MRVVYFSRDFTSHDHRFLRALAGTEHEVSFLRLESRFEDPWRLEVPDGVETIDWWGGRRRLRLVDYPRARAEVGRVLRRRRPDLVHAGPVQQAAFLTAASGFHPLVTMSWGSDLLREARHGWGRAAARYALRRSEVLVCDCAAVRDVAAGLGMAPDRTVTFPWGVDLDHFRPGAGTDLRSRLGWEEAFVFLSTRSWEPLYGVELLVEAFLAAAARLPSLRLLLLGQGSREKAILGRIARARMDDRVHRPGPVPLSMLPDYYRAADVYVSASRSDGSSVSLLEALACGIPALVSDIPGNREWVEPDVQGWLFADGDEADLSTAMVSAYDRRQELGRLGDEARRRAESRANWQTNFPILLRAYAMAVGEVR